MTTRHSLLTTLTASAFALSCSESSTSSAPADAAALDTAVGDDAAAADSTDGTLDGVEGTDVTPDGVDAADGLEGSVGLDTTDGQDGLDTSEGQDGLDATDGQDGLDTTDGSDSTDSDDGTVVSPTIVFTLSTPQLGTACTNTEIPVVFDVTEGEAYVIVELSDPSGGFDTTTSWEGEVLTVGQTTVYLSVPENAAPGTGYRVRARAGQDLVKQLDETFTIATSPTVELDWLGGSRPAVGEVITVTADSTGATSFTWDFGEGATVLYGETSSPSVSWDSGGSKPISVTALSANGCTATDVEDYPPATVFVLGCDVGIDAGASVIFGDVSEFGGGYQAWICGGGSFTAGGGAPVIFVEPGGSFTFTGGGVYATFVKAGATYYGGNNNAAIVYEPGATLVGVGSSKLVECPSLEFVPAITEGGCYTPGGEPVTVSVGAIPDVVCPSGTFEVPVVVTGTAGANNKFLVQLSDADGSFANATIVGSVAATTASKIPVTVDALPTGQGYRVRVITTDPPSVGAASSESFGVNSTLDASFTMSARVALPDSPVVFTDTTEDSVSRTWSFGVDATPTTSVDSSVDVSFASPGVKTISLSVTGADGCQDSYTVSSPVDSVQIVDCNYVAPANTTAVTGGDLFNPQTPSHICGGSAAGGFNIKTPVSIAPGASYHLTGQSLDSIVYVPAGAIFSGYSNTDTTIVTEPGSTIYSPGNSRILECPNLELDTSAVVGCPGYTYAAPTVSIETPGPVCSGDQVELAFSKTGLFAQGSSFAVEQSSADGDFSEPAKIGGAVNPQTTSFKVTLNGEGDAYRLRVRAEAPIATAETGPFTISKSPSIEYKTWLRMALVGTPVPFDATGDVDADLLWTAGDDAIISDPTAASTTITWDTPGQKFPTLTATNAAGCSTSFQEDWIGATVEVVSCNTVVPAGTTTLQQGVGSLSGSTLICDGASASDSGGYQRIYVRSGGTFTFEGGGGYYAFVEAGGTVNVGNGGQFIVLAEPGAIINKGNANPIVLECPDLTFDTSLVTPCN